MTLILTIAAEVGIPPYFAASIALIENPALDPLAINVNQNKTVDRGVFQLNSSWFNGDWKDPEINIRHGCNHIKVLMSKPGVNTYWSVAVVYNAGYSRLNNPPKSTIEYANKVIEKFNGFHNGNAPVVIKGRGK